MTKITLGIIGGGQLGSMLATAAKKLKIKTIIFSDDINSPGQIFGDEFLPGNYSDLTKINSLEAKLESKEKIIENNQSENKEYLKNKNGELNDLFSKLVSLN